jgi:hypothetical protein
LATYVSRFSSRPLNMELGILFCAILISRKQLVELGMKETMLL